MIKLDSSRNFDVNCFKIVKIIFSVKKFRPKFTALLKEIQNFKVNKNILSLR